MLLPRSRRFERFSEVRTMRTVFFLDEKKTRWLRVYRERRVMNR